MAIKPLPYRAQKRGKKISLILAIFFGLLFGSSLGGFIALNTQIKNDAILEPESGRVTSLKDVGDGFIYSTTDNYIVYCDYENKLISKTNVKDMLPGEGEIGKFDRINSINYYPDEEKLFVSCNYNYLNSDLNDEYLFEFIKNEDDKFVYDESSSYCCIKKPITSYTVHGDYLYALIRDSVYLTISKYNINDLSLGALDLGYLCRSKYEVNDNDQVVGINYKYLINAVPYSINYVYSDEFNNGVLYCVLDSFLIAIQDGCFNEFPFVSGQDGVIKNSTVDEYKKCITLNYGIGCNPHGSTLINDECYIITDDKTFAHFSFDDFDYSSISELMNDLEYFDVEETKIPNLSFSTPAPNSMPGLFYNKDSKIAVVTSLLGDTITAFDFSDLDNIQFLFEDAAEINITDVVITSNGENIYYLCQNSNITNDNLMMLKIKNVNSVFTNAKFGRFNPALLVTTIISLIIFLITLFAAVKPVALEKILAFFKNFKRNIFAYLILILCLTLLGMFCYYPAVGSISMSFFTYKNNVPIVWNNFGNYIEVFTNPVIWKSFGYMVAFLISDIITAIIPPLIFAFFLTVMKNKKVSAVTRTLLFLPSVIPGITKLFIWQSGIYGEFGLINSIIKLFNGEKVIFFNGGGFDIWALILMGFPYVGSYLVFYGALMNIPSSYYEAAELEGLNVWKRFFTIDIPLIQPQIKYVFILTIIASVQNFGRTYMINSSLFNIKTPIHIMYDYIGKGDYGLSSAIAAILFVILIFCTIFNMKKQKEQLGDSI